MAARNGPESFRCSLDHLTRPCGSAPHASERPGARTRFTTVTHSSYARIAMRLSELPKSSSRVKHQSPGPAERHGSTVAPGTAPKLKMALGEIAEARGSACGRPGGSRSGLG